MSYRAVVVLFVCMAIAATAGASDEGGKKPGLLQRTLHLFDFGSHGDKTAVHVKNLTLNMELSPLPVKLSENRQLKVDISLANRSNKHVHLEFPTTQRIEILIHNKDGKVVTQWSEDQAFSNEPGYVTINPGERIEYSASLSTRDLSAGQEYVVDGFFPNFKELQIQKTIAPVK